jgi:hypothetical protein
MLALLGGLEHLAGRQVQALALKDVGGQSAQPQLRGCSLLGIGSSQSSAARLRAQLEAGGLGWLQH